MVDDIHDEEVLEKKKEKKKKKKNPFQDELDGVVEVDNSDHPVHERYTKEGYVKE